jgi:RimJ/RimL family protein N-acetyltransferase
MKPILRDFPERLQTERLTIRAPRPGDGAEMSAAVCESWAELRQWMHWATGDPPTVQESEARLREGRAKFLAREALWLLLFLRGTDTLVGSSGLHCIDWDVPKFEIGYWVRTPYGGQGYVTEAVVGIAEFAFDVLDARRVEIRCDALNERSAAVARRASFTHEATLHNDARHHLTGRLRDTLVFARTVPDEEE